MTEILTITLAPSIDLATSVDRVTAGPKMRCVPPRMDPGGGGVNVARAIRQLGGHSRALLVIGGATGEQLMDLLNAEGVETLPIRVASQTRQSLAVTDQSTNEQYRFSLLAEPLGADDAGKILDGIASAVNKDTLVVLSGSVAPGLSVDFPHEIQSRIAHKTDRLIVDTSGQPLAHLMAHPTQPLHVLRIDQKEAATAAGVPLETVQSSVDFAASLVDRGVAQIVVTGRGADGSIMVTKDQHIFCHAPKVPVRSKIGAGDAFVGAMTLSMSRGEPLARTLQWGVAAASATVSTEGTALCGLEDVQRLLSACVTTII
ncbi:1-phosphofructokinase family hexose kinase [Puniceibacterium sediminis]|uniref:Phosphofructokinase n=1 Tax=Puniceibacterium sediminis TaxID=1608407 RepID=A0A238ZEB4_9RHOB|nr:hexose kinase [Puniceibacterium sediminis]SNR81338.1 6-phosphofructokinase [Puniceibacterium sediminis]